MDNLIFSFGYSLLKAFIYSAIVIVLIIQLRKGASWAKKLSVLVAGVFSAVKLLAELFFSVLYLRQYFLGGEQLQQLISISSELLNALSEIFISATVLLCLIYLGKVKRSKK